MKLILVLLALLLSGSLEASASKLNMANTVESIIFDIVKKACGFEDEQINPVMAKSGGLIYKREKIGSCINGIGNAYYIRCYDWGYDELREKELRPPRGWLRPTKDIKLDAYSCIPESEVEIPFHNKRLQRAKIGQKIYLDGRK